MFFLFLLEFYENPVSFVFIFFVFFFFCFNCFLTCFRSVGRFRFESFISKWNLILLILGENWKWNMPTPLMKKVKKRKGKLKVKECLIFREFLIFSWSELRPALKEKVNSLLNPPNSDANSTGESSTSKIESQNQESEEEEGYIPESPKSPSQTPKQNEPRNHGFEVLTQVFPGEGYINPSDCAKLLQEQTALVYQVHFSPPFLTSTALTTIVWPNVVFAFSGLIHSTVKTKWIFIIFFFSQNKL